MLDAWIRVDADGTITVFTGKVELGQGIKTALVQLAAEELVVGPARIRLITADTSRTPNEGYTAGSNSMKDSGTAIMNAAAQVREMLVGMAASRFNVPADSLVVEDGRVRAADGRGVAYAELVTGQSLHVTAQPQSRLRDPRSRTVRGKALPISSNDGVRNVVVVASSIEIRAGSEPQFLVTFEELPAADVLDEELVLAG